MPPVHCRNGIAKASRSKSIGLLRNIEHSRHVQNTRHDLRVMISSKLTTELALQEVLQAERQQFAQERDRLRNKLRGEELQIEARKLKDELIRLRRVRRWREESICCSDCSALAFSFTSYMHHLYSRFCREQ